MTAARTVPSTSPEPGAAPEWFVRALAAVPERHAVEVAGTTIRYRAWGDPGLPGVVLVHGGAAHSGWWDHIAPQLEGARVVALDLGGYGDSGRRDTYGMAMWAQEIAEVAAAEALDRPVVVGHSKGGWAAITAGVEHGDRFSGVVAIDSPLHVAPPDEAWLRRRQAPPRVYPDRSAATARFVTLPPQELVLPYVRQHVAEESVRPVDGGWTWKFDPRSFSQVTDQLGLLAALHAPFAVLRCEHGLLSRDMVDEIVERVPGHPAVVELPGCGHHPMLDHPQVLVTALRALLAVWPDGRSPA